MHIRSPEEGLEVFKALSSPVRLSILELLYLEGPLRVGDIAGKLDMLGGVLSPHIKQLELSGLINVEQVSGRRGMQKICSAPHESIRVDMNRHLKPLNVYEAEIGVGQYTSFDVRPTCGLARKEHLIGQVDDPRFFADPGRVDAEILWFSEGYVEYMLPNFLQRWQELVELQLSMELSSEAPGFCDNWPSDIHFHLNDRLLGHWTSPGDFGEQRGSLNPAWWHRGWNQHGRLKLLSINHKGSFIDGRRIGQLSLKELQIGPGDSLRLRLSVPDTAQNRGGLTIFGRSFGNYQQDIKLLMHYRNQERPEE